MSIYIVKDKMLTTNKKLLKKKHLSSHFDNQMRKKETTLWSDDKI
jgi:hypothetical protein